MRRHILLEWYVHEKATSCWNIALAPVGDIQVETFLVQSTLRCF